MKLLAGLGFIVALTALAEVLCDAHFVSPAIVAASWAARIAS